MLKASVNRLDNAANRLFERYSDDWKLQADIWKWIDGARHGSTGHLKWILEVDRYQLNCKNMKGGIWLQI
jgi:hypothetical protein